MYGGEGGGYLLWFYPLGFLAVQREAYSTLCSQRGHSPAPVSICFGRLKFGTCLAVSESQILFTISNTYKASWYRHLGGSMAEGVRIVCLSQERDEGVLYVGGGKGDKGRCA